MLLAAGLGERMRPLTQDRPKPALTVLGRSLAEQNLRRFTGSGIDLAVINLHYQPSVLRELLGDGGGAGLPAIEYTEEDPILGSGGGIQNASALLRGDGPFLVHNSDFLSDIDFQAMLEEHRDSQMAATLALVPARAGYSTVQIDARGRIISIAGKPEVAPDLIAGHFTFTGCHILDESLLDRLPRGESNIVTDLYQPLAAEGRLGGYLHPGFWWEFGTPKSFLEGQLELLSIPESERSAIAEHDVVRAVSGAEAAAIGAGVEIEDSARLGGRCAIALASRVGEEAIIEDSVIMEESWVGPQCNLRRCVIGPQTELPAGFEADNALIVADLKLLEPLPRGIERHEGLLIRPLEPPR